MALARPEEDNSEAGSTQKLGFLSGKSIRKDKCVGWLLLPRVGVKMQHNLLGFYLNTRFFFCGLFLSACLAHQGFGSGVGLCASVCARGDKKPRCNPEFLCLIAPYL